MKFNRARRTRTNGKIHCASLAESTTMLKETIANTRRTGCFEKIGETLTGNDSFSMHNTMTNLFNIRCGNSFRSRLIARPKWLLLSVDMKKSSAAEGSASAQKLVRSIMEAQKHTGP